MALERRPHRVGMLLPQAGRALEIGEQERHRSRRQLPHVTPSRSAPVPHDRTPAPIPPRIRWAGPAAAPPILDDHAGRTGARRPSASASSPSWSTARRRGRGGAEATGDEADDEAGEQITSPTKLIRIASMVRTMLDEVRRAPLDDAGRRRLREIHERSLDELEGVLSPDLQQELERGRAPVHRATRRASRSCASRRRSSSAGSRGCSTASRPRCSPSRRWRSSSSRRCAAAARSSPAHRRADRPERVPVSAAERRPHRGSCSACSRLDARLLARAARPRSSPTGPTPTRSTPSLDELRAAAAARVRGRGAQPHRGARARSPRARRSCSRPATAPSRSTRSRPTPSATSSRSSCRWPSCSPTAAACPR